MMCTLCDGNPYNAIKFDCGGCDQFDFCEECGERVSKCECVEDEMNIVEGDLIEMAKDGEFDVIVHGCNCFCTFGAGIAKKIAKEYPETFIMDRCTKYGDKNKLGTCSYAILDTVTVVNAYTQYDYTRNKMNVDYDALRECFAYIKDEFSGSRIGYPLIGAGLAGGDWEIIEKIINEELEGEDHTLVKYIDRMDA